MLTMPHYGENTTVDIIYVYIFTCQWHSQVSDDAQAQHGHTAFLELMCKAKKKLEGSGACTHEPLWLILGLFQVIGVAVCQPMSSDGKLTNGEVKRAKETARHSVDTNSDTTMFDFDVMDFQNLICDHSGGYWCKKNIHGYPQTTKIFYTK